MVALVATPVATVIDNGVFSYSDTRKSIMPAVCEQPSVFSRGLGIFQGYL